MFLNVFLTSLLGALAAGWQCGSPTMSAVNQPVKPGDTRSLQLASQYKRNKLEGISSDGNLLLFYETSKPVRTYTLQADGKGFANQPDTNTDVLRVVERASGRELGRIVQLIQTLALLNAMVHRGQNFYYRYRIFD